MVHRWTPIARRGSLRRREQEDTMTDAPPLVLINEDQIQSKINELAREISNDYGTFREKILKVVMR